MDYWSDLGAHCYTRLVEVYKSLIALLSIAFWKSVVDVWHSPEGNNTFRWSSGKSSKILLKVHPWDYIGINYLTIKIETSTYQPQRTNVLVNGIEVGVIEKRENWWLPSTNAFSINRSILGLDDTSSQGSKRVEIEFLIPNALIPAVLEPQASQDFRVLGIALYGMNVIPEE